MAPPISPPSPTQGSELIRWALTEKKNKACNFTISTPLWPWNTSKVIIWMEWSQKSLWPCSLEDLDRTVSEKRQKKKKKFLESENVSVFSPLVRSESQKEHYTGNLVHLPLFDTLYCDLNPFTAPGNLTGTAGPVPGSFQEKKCVSIQKILWWPGFHLKYSSFKSG